MTKHKRRRPRDEVRLEGEHVCEGEPVWGPLEALVGLALAGHFMWMGSVRLDDGSELQVYKHRWTRRSIHVAADNRCFYYDWGGETIPDRSAPSEYVQAARFSMLIAVFDWSSDNERWWSDERTDQRIRDALRNTMDGKAYLVQPSEFDKGAGWDELDDDWHPKEDAA